MSSAETSKSAIDDVLALYAVSLAVGTSLDPHENCAAFFNALKSEKQLAYASVWLRPEHALSDSLTPFTLLCANHSRGSESLNASTDHPFVEVLSQQKPRLIGVDNLHLSALRPRGAGAGIIYALADFGVLELYRALENDAVSVNEVESLQAVVDKFSLSISGSLAYSESQHAERELRQSEYRYRTLVESLPQRFFLKSADSVYISCSGNMAADLDSNAEAIAGKTDFDFFPEAFAEKQQRNDRRVMAALAAEEFDEEIVLNGSRRQIHMVKAPALDESGHVSGVLGMYADVTEAKAAREQVARLVASVEHAQDAIIISDLEARIQYVNPAFEKMTGYSIEEAVGEYVKILRSDKHPDSFYVEMLETVRQGDVWRGEMIIRCKDGSLCHVERNVAPVFDGEGNIQCQVNIQRDISEQKNMEEKLLHAQKMESLGTMVGGVAHEFNNALAGMAGRLFLLKGKLPESSPGLNDIDVVEKLCFRSADMVKQMLAFARKSPLQMSMFDLTAYVQETFNLHRFTVPANITLRTTFTSRSLHLHGDKTHIQQIIVNLLSNARDAVQESDNPEICIAFDPFEPDAPFLRAHPEAGGKQFARLSVSDNGCGIADEQLPHIFEPFYTTKEVGAGTGLGLSMLHGACAMHGGYVDITSAVEVGTAMHVYLPVSEFDVQSGVQADLPFLSGQGEVVLLVDDDEMLRNTGARVLKRLGYGVLEAGDGQQAVELFERHHDEISLVMMDVVMPRMGGIQAAKMMQQIRSETPVLFCTGYDKNNVLAGSGVSDEMVVSKPFSMTLISRKIRECLVA